MSAEAGSTGTPAAPSLKTHIRLCRGGDIAFGPGKAALLAAIADTGSISAAARHLGMSYRRAWSLVETMNRCFREPLVSSVTGGAQGGGARLSPLGTRVLAAYTALQADVDARVAAHADALYALVRP